MFTVFIPRWFCYSSLFCLAALSTGCDRLGVPNPERDAAIKEADANATGAACRHAGRGIEDCYAKNPEAARASVYAGWVKMNDYMRENKMEDIKPVEDTAASTAESSASAATEGNTATKTEGK
jgi:hypothetical protein